MRLILLFLLLTCPVAALLLLVRLVCSIFSSKVKDQIQRHPTVHYMWAAFAFIGLFLLFGMVEPSFWPLQFIERRGQRQKVLERVQNAGGWDAVRLGCGALASNHLDGFAWMPAHSNVRVYPNPQAEPQKYYITNLDYGPLPAAIAALQPAEIYVFPARLTPNLTNQPGIAVVRVKIFGMHSTGGHSTPYYGLEVPYGAETTNYTFMPSAYPSGHKHSTHRIADGIFEAY